MPEPIPSTTIQAPASTLETALGAPAKKVVSLQVDDDMVRFSRQVVREDTASTVESVIILIQHPLSLNSSRDLESAYTPQPKPITENVFHG